MMRDVHFFSLTMDRTTDASSKEQETLFLRTSKGGNIITRFLSIGEPKSTTAKDLHAHIMDQLRKESMDTHMSKFVGFGCDGAANMIVEITEL